MDRVVTGDMATKLFSSCEPDELTHCLAQTVVFNVSRRLAAKAKQQINTRMMQMLDQLAALDQL